MGEIVPFIIFSIILFVRSSKVGVAKIKDADMGLNYIKSSQLPFRERERKKESSYLPY